MNKGDNIPEMSGPQATRVFKMAASIIDLIEYRHEFAFMTSAYYADVIAGNGSQLILCGGPAPRRCLEAMFAQPRQTWFYFEKFQKRFALLWKKASDGAPDHEGWWELEGAAAAQRPDDGDPEAAEGGGPPVGPNDGPVYSFSGGFFLPPPERKQRAQAPRRGRRPQPPAGPVDQGRAVALPKAQPVAAAKRVVARVLCKTRRALRRMRLRSRLRHIKSQIEGRVAEMKAIARLTRDTAHALTTVARRWVRRGAVELRAILTDFDHAAYHVPTRLEAKSFELRQGFTLVLYSFDNIPWKSGLFGDLEHPKWESWLFGRLVEDERLSA
jgi:hypothetical protein